MELDDRAEQVLSGSGDSPAACSWYFGDQASYVEPFEQPASFAHLAAADLRVVAFDKELATEVLVVEPVHEMVAREHRLKQPDILGGSWIKASIASLTDHFPLSEPLYPLVGRRGVVDDREGFQVPVIGGSGNVLELVEIHHAFVHGAPHHLRAPVSRAPAADAKLARVVDHGLNPQDLAELVIHLQPVVFHAMFDPGTWSAVLLRVGEDFAGKVPMQLAAEEGEDVLGTKVDRGVVQHPLVELRELAAAGEQDVRAVLGLLNRPIVAALFEPGLAEQRVELSGPIRHLPNPRQPAELVGQPLSASRRINLDKGVVALAEADSLVGQLLGQPVVAVHVDLDRVREPSLQPDVHQTEVGIDAVVVEHSLRTVGKDQLGPPAPMTELDGAAGFLAAEDGHQPRANSVPPDQVLDEAFLAKLSLPILVGPAGLLRQGLGMLHQPVGQLFEHRNEILAADAEHVVHKRVQVSVPAKGKVPLENDSIKTRQSAYNDAGELLHEVVHGVLLVMAGDNNHHAGRTPFFLPASLRPPMETNERSRYKQQSLSILTPLRRLRRRSLFGCGRRPR